MHRILVFSVFVVASCGIAYELIAGAMASYLLGDSILQFSSIIGCYLFAMGIGAALSRYVPEKDLLSRFVDIELAVGLIGGCSAVLLFSAFAWLSAPFRTMLYALVFSIGVLVGMEIPLVMRVLHARKAVFSELVSKVLTFDSLGALAVSLLFPLVLAPSLGLIRTAFLFGCLNVAVALWTIWHFRSELPNYAGQRLRAVFVFAALLAGFTWSEPLTLVSEKRIFGDDIVHSVTTPYQRLVVTRWKDDTRLYINGNLQFSSRDEHRYHEALVHPVMAARPLAREVLVLGGGDGMAIREVLKYPQVQRVTLVDLDEQMTSLFKDSGELSRLNARAFHDPRVRVINADAAQWLESSSDMFDAVIVDFPDPSTYGLGKLYSVPFYKMLARHVRAGALVSIQSTSPYFAPKAFWSIEATLKEAGWHVRPYHVYVPSFGEWGFMLASRAADYTVPTHIPVPTRFLTPELATQMFLFPPDMPRLPVEPNYLNSQPLVRYFEEGWSNVMR
ncbi:polyamine aminopropyltransferase [Hydrogenophaga sp.]|uniref:polyamine aminopropyltransferase n=1 Tax=Hydrogenophaga sp. TaxID=1904254 RepID=UPI00271B51B2|nr:polyamine aminopropyltransferase [Hydrogenophaga sp.]MDO9438848.1 polyamine aminopropyltransferase [Hydrogenophaga sp.]